MTQPQDKTKSIFLNAVEIPTPGEREAYLAAACGDDARLRREVEALLQHHPALGSFLETAAVERPQPLLERPGTVIGPYKLLEQIGEGGFGIVFMAEQTQPVKRKVALKVIKPGMDTRQVIARFEAERQALALMDHPNIAKVLDAGATETGRPFFVMELVRGVPITQYCDQAQLTPRERLELFVAVCHAMQHAHQKGIIHRDIKPTNILVTQHDDRPVAMLIDFGVAKATSGQLTDKTLFTGFAQVIGTPLYMSPEQTALNAIDIDTRSDIYSLGVLLYELLTGTTPLDHARLEQSAFDEIRRIIREEEPPTPSARLSTLGKALPGISAVRRTAPRKLSQLVKGDLDWIVMKALEKDRARRYETANGFAADVERYLADEPVLACPPSAAYRFRKFARRNKPALTMTSVVLLVALLAVGSIGWMVRDRGAREVEAAREQAARQARLTGQVALVLEEAHRREEEQKWPEALVAVQRAKALVAGGEVESGVQEQVRQAARDLEFLQKLEGIRLERSDLRNGRFNDAGAVAAYAQAFRDYGVDLETLPVDEAVSRLKGHAHATLPLAAAIDDFAEAWGAAPETADAFRLSLVTIARGLDPDPARDQLRSLMETPNTPEHRAKLQELAESVDIARQYPGTLLLLSRTLGRAGQEDLSLSLLRRAQQRHPDDFWVNLELARTLGQRGDDLGATRFYTVAVALRPANGVAHNNLGVALDNQGHIEEAEACFRRSIEVDPTNAIAHSNLGVKLRQQNKLSEAEACFRRAIEVDPTNTNAHSMLGELLRLQRNLVEAEASGRRAIELDPTNAVAHRNLGDLLSDQNKREEAEGSYHRAIELDPMDADAHSNLGYLLSDQNQLKEAEACYRRAIELREESLKLCKARNGADHPTTLASIKNLAYSYYGRGYVQLQAERYPEAIADFARTVDLVPGEPVHWYRAAAVYLYAGDIESYRGACHVLLDRADALAAENPQVASMAAKTCALVPDSVPDFSRVARLAQRIVTGTEEHRFYRLFVLAMGLTEYRGGRHEQAVEWLERFEPKADGTHWDSSGFAALAMANHRLGHADVARTSLVSARAIIAYKPQDWLQGGAWFDWVHCEILCREAEAMMGRVSEEELSDLSRAPEALAARARWLLSRGRVHLQAKRLPEAIADFDRAIELAPREPGHLSDAAVLYLYAGDVERYRGACRVLLDRAEALATEEPQVAERAAKTCALAPDSVPDFSRVERLAQRSVTGTEEHDGYRSSLLAKGLTESRGGHHEQAIEWLERFAPKADGTHWDSSAFAALAMAHHRLGHAELARASLVSARAILARKPEDWLAGIAWFDWMHCEILCREADGLMGSMSKADLAPERRDNEPVDQSRAVERKRTSSIELLEESLKLCKAKNGADHPETLAGMKKLAYSYHKRGRSRVEAKRFHEAIADFDKAIELAPRDLDHLYAAATLSLYAGDVERYRGACRVLLDRAEALTAANPQDAAQAAATCALAPDSVPDFSRVARLAQRSVSGTEKHPNYGLFVLPMGLVEYRGGRHEQAVEWLGRLPPSADGNFYDSTASAALAMAHHRLGHADAARASLVAARAVIARKPEDWVRRADWHFWMFCEILCREAEELMGSVGENELRNRRDRELADLSQAVVRHPGSPNVLEARAPWLLNHGRFDAADLDYARLLQLYTKDHWHWYYRACLLAYLGREDEYREHCRAMLSQFADATDFYTLDRTTKSALLLPDGAGGDVEELARRAERSFQLSPTSTWSVLLKGLAECRAGRYEPAIGWLEKVSTAPSGSSPDSVTRTVAARAYLSIARHRLGQEAEARAALEQDALEASKSLPSVESGDLSKGGIENWLMAQTALREAEATVLGRRLPDPPQATGPAVPPPPPSPSTPSPFGGKPRAVPGVVQAEDFDEGGEGVAYHDTTYQNLGGRYRRDSVDIDDCADSGGGFNIGGVLAGEWLVYTVGVNEAGLYDLDLRLSSPGGGKLHVEFGGKDVTGSLDVPRTGGDKWSTVTARGVRLDAGRRVMRVVFDSAGTNVHVAHLNWIEARRTRD